MVSIIIPNYNKELALNETLNSVFCQTYKDWECIITDDGSTDNSKLIINEFLNKDKRFIYLERPINNKKGPSSCRNIGIENANGDYIVFLDSDDLLAKDCLENRVSTFEKAKSNDFLIFQMEVFNNNSHLFEIKVGNNKISKKECLYQFISIESVWQITAPIYKTDFLKNKIQFNEDLLVYEDLEFATKAIFNANEFAIINVIDSFYRNDANYFNKINELDFIKKTINSFEIYTKEIDKIIITHCKNDNQLQECKKSVLIGFKKIYRYITAFSPHFFHQNNTIFNFLLEKKYLSFKDKFVFYLSNFLLKNFYKYKGFGMFRFIEFLIK